jgi:predicted nucleic acid-binding protein
MLPLRPVIDTIVVISAALKPDGLQRTVLLLAQPNRQGYMFPKLFFPNTAKCWRGPNSRFVQASASNSCNSYTTAATSSHPLTCYKATSDPDDNMFLECADAARADYLITGNQRHFPKFWKQTKVITTREFITVADPHLVW